ncbi:MFS transporter [Humibacter ginsenosidimutans]|uniref:MFS transporter n=1 Tax=Humibacter ginsenosidimutans TaxID=2599293 RepID=UPI001FEEB3CD|nr:MFS transporter [Humibacter ginsenosidimutans]
MPHENPEDDRPASPRRSVFVDLAPLRQSPPFARLWLGGAISGIGGQMTIVAIGLQVYDLTHSTLAVSGVALFALVPMVFFGIYGGMLADVFDRRLVALLSAIVAWGSTFTIALLAWLHVDNVWLLYLLATLNSVAATVIGATRMAIYPRLLTRELLPAASALGGISTGVMVTVGPALAGVLVAAVGFGWTYSVDVVLFVFAFLGIATLPSIVPEGDAARPGWESLREGLAFLRRAPNVRMSFIVDIIAMTFGQPRVMLPAAGALLLGGGAITVGVLTASFAIGALVCSVFSGPLGHVRMQGLAVGRSVIVYGAFTLAFGVELGVLSTGWFGSGDAGHPQVAAIAIACVLFAGAGAADNVSAIFRQTILQSATPDTMRGRIQGVFTVVVSGGPRVGDLYAGVATALVALWFPMAFGGLVIITLVAVLMRVQRTFRHYDAMHPVP